MIPEPISLMPLTIAMLLGVAACAYAAYKAGVGVATYPRNTNPWKAAVILTAASVIVGATMAGFQIFASLNHDRTYSDAVWTTLAKDYHVESAVAGAQFKANTPFAALHEGQAVECTVSLPNIVVCGGEKVAETIPGN